MTSHYAYRGHYFGGQEIDPNFVIDRFRELLSFLPKSIVKTAKKITEKKLSPKDKKLSPKDKKVKLNFLEGEGKLGVRGIRKILDDQGYSEEEAVEFMKRLNKAKNRINESANENTTIKAVVAKFDSLMGYTREREEGKRALITNEQELRNAEVRKTLLEGLPAVTNKDKKIIKEALKKETKKIADVKQESADFKENLATMDQDLHEVAEEGAKTEYDLIQTKAKRLADVLASKYNFKKKTKIPTKLQTEFMATYPEHEDEIIAKYASDLEAVKVKNDEEDAKGKVKEKLDAEDLQVKMAKLAAKRIGLQKAIKRIASDSVAPIEILEKFKANPKGKVKVKGLGKKTKQTQDIEKIKVII